MSSAEHDAVPASAESTKRVVDAFFAAVGRGDKGAALALVGDQVDWGGAGDLSIPWIGDRHTLAEVGDFLDLLAKNLSTAIFDVEETIIDVENAVLVVNVNQTVTKTGREFAGHMVFLVTVLDSKIVRYRYFEDSLALARAYGSV